MRQKTYIRSYLHHITCSGGPVDCCSPLSLSVELSLLIVEVEFELKVLHGWLSMHIDVMHVPSPLHTVEVIFDRTCPYVDIEAKLPVTNIIITPAITGIRRK